MVNQRGVTLFEILTASVVGSLIAGGTLMAFLMSARISQTSSSTVEAASLAQQTIERFRNRVACDDGTWYTNDSNCAPVAQNSTDPMPGGAVQPSIQMNATRTYQATPQDCDGDGAMDCQLMKVTVSWPGS